MLYTRLIEELKEAKKNIEGCLINGRPNDMAEYKFYVGQIKGLQDAIDICQNVFKRSLGND